eukprot:evm.model.scf_2205.2 EVM.evm.TU.scf_2205.2   scf_2205:19630-24234(+)
MSTDGRSLSRLPSFPRRMQLGGLISGSDYGLSASPAGSLGRFASGDSHATPTGHRASPGRWHDGAITPASAGVRSPLREEGEGSAARPSLESLEYREGYPPEGGQGSHQTPREQRGLLQFGWPASVPSGASLGSLRSPTIATSNLHKQLEYEKRLQAESGPLEEQPADDLEAGKLTMPLLPTSSKPSIRKSGGHIRFDSVMKAIIYGFINAIVAAPTMVSYGAVVFEDPHFKPFMDLLVKQVFLASALDQVVMVFRSSLPAAIGQVQDVGLIFMSTMASSIMSAGMKMKLTPQEAVGATLVTLSVSTFIVGLLVTATGCLKLAVLVQYVPIPVVGGYLGYVGFFCIMAGAFLSAGDDVDV